MTAEKGSPDFWELRELLAPLGVYDLSPGSVVTAELHVYAAALRQFGRNMAQTLDDLFPASCSPQRLAQWERLLDLPAGRASLEARRGMVLVCRRAARLRAFVPTGAKQGTAPILCCCAKFQ